MNLLRTNRNYRLLFSASSISNLGDGIAAMAFPWLATLLSRDPMAIAMVAMASRLPWLFFSLPVGVLTDRLDRRLLMVQADIFRVILTLGVIALIFSAGPLPAANSAHLIWLLAGAAFLIGTTEVFRDNAAQTMLPSVVHKDQLETANGQMWSAEQIAGSFVGPPLAGFLIAYWVPLPFGINALAFALSAWALWCISITRVAPPVRRKFMTEMMEGLRWMWGHKIILRFALMLGLLNAFATMTITVFVLFSQEILHLNATQHGLLMTAGAFGGVAGGLLCPKIINRLGTQRSIHLALALFPLPALIIFFTASPLIAAIALFAEMFVAILWNVVTVSYRQRFIPDALLGRVNAIYRFFGWGMMPLGALAAGLVVELAEPDLGREFALRLSWCIAALGYAMMLVYGLFRLKI